MLRKLFFILMTIFFGYNVYVLISSDFDFSKVIQEQFFIDQFHAYSNTLSGWVGIGLMGLYGGFVLGSLIFFLIIITNLFSGRDFDEGW